MFSSLLTFAEVTSQAAEATGPSKIMHDFGISWPGIAAQVLNVGIVVFILWKFAFKPVLATLASRRSPPASSTPTR
jgi:F-type H+-transporting ATPase subunit b